MMSSEASAIERTAVRTFVLTAALACFAVACASDSSGGALDPDAASDGVELGDAAHADSHTADTTDAVADVLPDDLATALQRAVDETLDAAIAPGVAAGVQIPAAGFGQGAAGVTESRGDEPASPAHRFRIGSMTKTFVSTVVLQLVAEGAFALDTPVDELVAGFDLGEETTVERLLNHTSGIFNYTDDAAFLGRSSEHAEPEEVIRWALDHGDEFEPGSAWSYSNTNYYLLGLAIEETTGKSVSAAIRERLLEPLGLHDTFLEGEEEIPGGTITGHTLGGDASDLLDMSWAWASGGMVSTVGDVCRWAEALRSGELLPADLQEKRFAPTRLPDGSTAPYAYGLRYTERADVVVVGHTGSTMGFNSEFFFEREPGGICVAVLTNDFFGETEPVAHALWRIARAEAP